MCHDSVLLVEVGRRSLLTRLALAAFFSVGASTSASFDTKQNFME